jgi:predicted nicotinamide N-methyase
MEFPEMAGPPAPDRRFASAGVHRGEAPQGTLSAERRASETVRPVTDLEFDLRSRFSVETRSFREGATELEIVLPAAPDELIDVSAFNVDERLPYWAELWPSARALARFLLRQPPAAGPVLELGCGVALPSLVLLARGCEVLATDYYPEALEFARVNAERNRLPPLTTRLLDWRDPPGNQRFQLVLAADVLYEERNAVALAALLPSLVAPGGSFLLADPGRTYRNRFHQLMGEIGWQMDEVASLVEPAGQDDRAGSSTVTISRVHAGSR